MIKRRLGHLLGAAMMSSLAMSAGAAEIVRHAGPARSIILGSVTVPHDAELVFVSGQLAAPAHIGLTSEDAQLGDTRMQTVSALNRIKALLAAQGYSMADVIKLTVFVVGDPKLGGRMDFDGFNKGYRQFFGTPENPHLVARSTVQVAGLAGPRFLVEIEAIAARVPQAAARPSAGASRR